MNSVCLWFSCSCHSSEYFQSAGRGEMSLHFSQYSLLNCSVAASNVRASTAYSCKSQWMIFALKRPRGTQSLPSWFCPDEEWRTETWRKSSARAPTSTVPHRPGDDSRFRRIPGADSDE